MKSHDLQIGKSLLWSATSSLGTQILSFVTFAVLARLLGATAFGIVAIAALIIDLLLVVSNAGISEAVVQRRVLDEDDADTAFWVNFACGLILCASAIVTAPLLSRAFGDPRLEPIIKALSVIFIITPLGAIHTARLTRELQFRSVAMRNIVASVAGAVVGLPLALGGYDIWALVGQRITVALVMSISAWASLGWVPRLRFKWKSCRELVKFGGFIGLSGTLNQVNIRSAEIISGLLVGPVAVAFIRAGSRIVEVLNQITYMPFQQIAMPTLARTTHEPHILRETYLRLSRLSAFIMFPAFLGCLALADAIVSLIFGPGWEPVADALRIFACAVVASQINNLMVAVITASGHSQTVLSWTLTQIALGVAAATAVHHWGWQAMLLTGVARGYLVLPYGFHLLHKHVGISFRDILISIKPALSSALLMVLIVVLGARASRDMFPSIAIIAIWLPIGAGIYLSAYIWQDRAIISQIHDLLRAAVQRRLKQNAHG